MSLIHNRPRLIENYRTNGSVQARSNPLLWPHTETNMVTQMWIDKKRLNDELTAWVMNGKTSKMPEYVGISAYKITNKILSMPSFRNYTETWLDSMKSAGVEHCIMAAQKFNPTLSNKNVNAFSLMWTYGLRGVVNALKAEKRQYEIREDFTQHAISLGIISTQDVLDAEI